MSDLAATIRSVTDLWDEPLDEVRDVPQIVNAILASDWLAAEKAKWQAEGVMALGSLLVDISRVTVVTAGGRAYESAYDAFDGIEIHIQDDGRTLKVLPAREKGSDDER